MWRVTDAQFEKDGGKKSRWLLPAAARATLPQLQKENAAAKRCDAYNCIPRQLPRAPRAPRFRCRRMPPPCAVMPPIPLLLLILSTAALFSLASSLPDTPDDQDPFNIMRDVDAHAVAERNADRAVAAADARARQAETRAHAADAAASASRDLALHFQIESNSRLSRIDALDAEVEQLKRLLGAAVLDKEALLVSAHARHAIACPAPISRRPPRTSCRARATTSSALSQAKHAPRCECAGTAAS